MSKESVIILGFGGNAVDFFETVSSAYSIIGFVDDEPSKHTLSYKGIKVHGREFLDKHPEAKVISLIGSEKTFHIRNEIINKFNINPSRFGKAIHPKAVVCEDAVIGYDVVIMPGVVVTSNAKIGNHIFILANSILHHDVEVADHTLIGSNVTLAGHVKIGKSCFIGSGTSIISNVSVGEFSMVGMASNVIRNVSPGAKVVGNPARSI